jgi:hypothetical protein
MEIKFCGAKQMPSELVSTYPNLVTGDCAVFWFYGLLILTQVSLIKILWYSDIRSKTTNDIKIIFKGATLQFKYLAITVPRTNKL